VVLFWVLDAILLGHVWFLPRQNTKTMCNEWITSYFSILVLSTTFDSFRSIRKNAKTLCIERVVSYLFLYDMSIINKVTLDNRVRVP